MRSIIILDALLDVFRPNLLYLMLHFYGDRLVANTGTLWCLDKH